MAAPTGLRRQLDRSAAVAQRQRPERVAGEVGGRRAVLLEHAAGAVVQGAAHRDRQRAVERVAQQRVGEAPAPGAGLGQQAGGDGDVHALQAAVEVERPPSPASTASSPSGPMTAAACSNSATGAGRRATRRCTTSLT